MHLHYSCHRAFLAVSHQVILVVLHWRGGRGSLFMILGENYFGLYTLSFQGKKSHRTFKFFLMFKDLESCILGGYKHI